MSSSKIIVGYVVALGAVAMVLKAAPVQAVPAYAEQTGQNCAACHVGGFGPELTPFGREFKIRGYTMRSGKSVPVSAMLVGSFLNTARAQSAPPADGYKTNNNLAFDQGSLFLAGGIGQHVGGLAQFTYDGIGKAWSWDNLDLRLVNTGTIGSADVVYGLSVNNNPTVQDPWNTTPAWGYPYTGSGLAPSPGAAPLLSGGLAQAVLGATAYAWIDQKFYLEAGGYSTPSVGTLRWLGSDPIGPGDIDGVAPYGRFAYQQTKGNGTLEVGAFALHAGLWPGRDRSTGLTDRFTDYGLDASYINSFASGDTLAFNGRWTHEKFHLDGSCALAVNEGSIAPGTDNCADGSLDEIHGDAAYYFKNRLGVTVGASNISGTTNPLLYANNRIPGPGSTALTGEISYSPTGGDNPPLGKRVNLRVGAQYTLFTSFNGAAHNYDGQGTDAWDNNSLRVYAWVAF